MTREEYLLVCLLEELGEASQVVSKGLRFGLGCYHPDDPTTDNADLIAHEVNDVLAVALLLQEDNVFQHIPDGRMIRKKQEKLQAYMRNQKFNERREDDERPNETHEIDRG